jgi:hypothetical protein
MRRGFIPQDYFSVANSSDSFGETQAVGKNWLDVGLGCSTRHVEIFFQAMLQMTWLRGMFGRQWVGRPGNAF